MNRAATILFLLSTTFIFVSAQNTPPTAEQIRLQLSTDIKALHIEPEKIFKIENRSVWTGSDSIKIRVYYPNDETNNAIVFNIHGGALVACDLETHDNISRALANRAHAVVVAIDYRKPPEYPYPASINDCEKVLVWIKQYATSIAGNPKKIFLIGDSGGGLIITSLAVKLQNNLGVKGICLINPATDLSMVNGGFYGLVTQMYLNNKSPKDSMISPILATNFNYYPPTLIVTCEEDELKPQGTALYQKLTKNGIKVDLMDISSEDHLGSLWAANHPRAKLALDKVLAFLVTLE